MVRANTLYSTYLPGSHSHSSNPPASRTPATSRRYSASSSRTSAMRRSVPSGAHSRKSALGGDRRSGGATASVSTPGMGSDGAEDRRTGAGDASRDPMGVLLALGGAGGRSECGFDGDDHCAAGNSDERRDAGGEGFCHPHEHDTTLQRYETNLDDQVTDHGRWPR
jgi:hypothetical protein